MATRHVTVSRTDNIYELAPDIQGEGEGEPGYATAVDAVLADGF